MEPSEILYPGTVILDGRLLDAIRGVKLDHQTLEIKLPGRAAIRIYTFNTLMLRIEAERTGTERFAFTGPRLGMYHDTADIREGPCVNHFISELEIEIGYPSKLDASFRILGRADLAASSVDRYWYQGARAGTWSFEANFSYRFKALY